jgi:hypothetical protein
MGFKILVPGEKAFDHRSDTNHGTCPRLLFSVGT